MGSDRTAAKLGPIREDVQTIGWRTKSRSWWLVTSWPLVVCHPEIQRRRSLTRHGFESRSTPPIACRLQGRFVEGQARVLIRVPSITLRSPGRSRAVQEDDVASGIR